MVTEMNTHRPQSNSCYLDGRYFNIVLKSLGVKGLVDPLHISLDEGRVIPHPVFKLSTSYETSGLLYVRVVVEGNLNNIKNRGREIRHSCLLIVNKEDKICWFWNPQPHSTDVLNIISRYMLENNYKLNVLTTPVPQENKPRCCAKSGYCNAYVLKYVIDLIYGNNIDLSNIREFMYEIENSYSIPPGEPDIEYDVGFSGTGAAIGGGTGALIGILGGPVGVVVGGLTGALVGGVAGGALEKPKYVYLTQTPSPSSLAAQSVVYIPQPQPQSVIYTYSPSTII